VLDEQGLIRQVLRGHRNAFAVLLEKYGGPIFAYCLDRTGNRADAEDLAQEVFIIAYRRLATLNKADSFLQWLYGIARNLIMNHFRTRKALFSINDNPAGSAAVPDVEAGIDMQDIVREAVAELPEKYRVVVTLRFMQSMSYREIAKEFGTTTGHVSSMLSRANKHLEAKLRKYFAPEPME
jgi:RNA polymerase sigma-70 factor (ECF subfamily)